MKRAWSIFRRCVSTHPEKWSARVKFIRDTYQDNLPVRNRMRLGGEVVNLKKIRCPALNVVAEHDDIVPPESSVVLMDLIGSRKKEQLRFKGGHHGITIGSSARKLVWPKTAEWLRMR